MIDMGDDAEVSNMFHAIHNTSGIDLIESFPNHVEHLRSICPPRSFATAVALPASREKLVDFLPAKGYKTP
jgi:hypothetical protein